MITYDTYYKAKPFSPTDPDFIASALTLIANIIVDATTAGSPVTKAFKGYAVNSAGVVLEDVLEYSFELVSEDTLQVCLRIIYCQPTTGDIWGSLLSENRAI